MSHFNKIDEFVNIYVYKIYKKKAPKTRCISKKTGANDEARTHDNRYHKPGLYQLSYVRHLSYELDFYKETKIKSSKKNIKIFLSV